MTGPEPKVDNTPPPTTIELLDTALAQRDAARRDLDAARREIEFLRASIASNQPEYERGFRDAFEQTKARAAEVIRATSLHWHRGDPRECTARDVLALKPSF